MIPKFPEFHKLVADHKEAIEAYTRIFPPYSDYTFPSLWSWNIHEQIELSDLNGNLVVRFTDYVTNEKFLSFLGNKEVNKTLEALFTLIERAPGYLSYLKLIPEHNLHGIHLSNGFEAVEDPDNHDYVFSVPELAAFSGGKYKTNRGHINYLLKSHKPKFVELNLSSKDTCRELEILDRIWIERQVKKGNDIANNIGALKRLVGVADIFDFLAAGIYVDENLVGYSVCEFNHCSYANALFEQTDTTYSGISPLLRKELAGRLKARGCEWVNYQQDLGIPGLRKSKQQYHPAFFLKKLIIQRARKSHDDV